MCISFVSAVEVAIHSQVFKQTCEKIFFFSGSFFIQVAKVSFVFLWRVLKSLYSIVVEVHAEPYTLIKHELWIIWCVDISDRERFHPLLIMVKNCIDDTISDSFSYNMFCFFDWIESQALFNIGNGDLWVTYVDFFQSEFDNSMSQSLDECQILIGTEYLLVLCNKLPEFFHISRFGTLNNLEVGI